MTEPGGKNVHMGGYGNYHSGILGRIAMYKSIGMFGGGVVLCLVNSCSCFAQKIWYGTGALSAVMPYKWWD